MMARDALCLDKVVEARSVFGAALSERAPGSPQDVTVGLGGVR